MQLGDFGHQCVCRLCFNPHRARRPGATQTPHKRRPPHPVSILTGPEGPVQRDHRLNPPHPSRCFNPHRARRPGATLVPTIPAPMANVSILTGPEGPVQQTATPHSHLKPDVSILTGPEGPVQHVKPLHALGQHHRFNPHRARRPGATVYAPLTAHVRNVSILTGPEGPVQRYIAYIMTTNQE